MARRTFGEKTILPTTPPTTQLLMIQPHPRRMVLTMGDPREVRWPKPPFPEKKRLKTSVKAGGLFDVSVC
jgi:hypothetical protein